MKNFRSSNRNVMFSLSIRLIDFFFFPTRTWRNTRLYTMSSLHNNQIYVSVSGGKDHFQNDIIRVQSFTRFSMWLGWFSWVYTDLYGAAQSNTLIPFFLSFLWLGIGGMNHLLVVFNEQCEALEQEQQHVFLIDCCTASETSTSRSDHKVGLCVM